MAKKVDDVYRISADQLRDEMKNRKIIRCGLTMDIGLGGGVPMGSVVLLGGKAKLGKTTIALQYGANAQNAFGSKIFYFNIEQRLTDLVLRQIRGIKTDIDNFEIIMPPVLEDVDGNKVGHEKWPTERWLEEIGKTIIDNKNVVIIVDSIASMSSGKEQSESIGYQDRGSAKKLEAQFCRRDLVTAIHNGNAVFLLTQIQANPSGYGPAMLLKAGNSILHHSDIIMLAKGRKKWAAKTDESVAGHDILIRVDSSALGPPEMNLEVPLRYGYGIDDIKDVITHSISWGIVVQKGAWFKVPFLEGEDPDMLDDCDNKDCVKICGEVKLRNWLLIRPRALQQMEDKIRNQLFGGSVSEDV